MEPSNATNNCFYDDNMNPLMMGDVLFHERLDSKGSNTSSLKSAHGQKKRSPHDSLYRGENTHMGYDDSYHYQNDTYNFNHAQGHHHGESHTNQNLYSNVYSSDNASNNNYYGNRCKEKPRSSRSSRSNMCNGYFQVYDTFMDGNSEMPEMVSKNWAGMEADNRSSKKFSEHHNSERSINSNYSLASIGATGLPSPVKPFHWVPNQAFFDCDYEYMDQQNSFLHAAIARYCQQQQNELNDRNDIGAYPQGPSYLNNTPQSEYRCSNAYNENRGSNHNNNCEETPDEIFVACVESNAKLPFCGPIGILGRIAAKKFHKLKDSIETEGTDERELRLNVWCDWDILLEATYVDSPRGLDELEENKEESRVEEPPSQNPTKRNDGRVPEGEKHAAGDDVPGAVSRANDGFTLKAQNKCHGHSQKGGDTRLKTSCAQNCSGNIATLENSSEVYLFPNSMMNLWNQDGRNCGSLCQSKKSLTKSTIASTTGAPKSSLGSRKSVEAHVPPLTSFDSGEGDDSVIDSTLQKSRLQQQQLNPKKKSRTFTRKVKKILNKLTLGSLFNIGDEVHYLVGLDSDSTGSGSTRNSSNDTHNHSKDSKNNDPTRAIGGPLEADNTQNHSVTSAHMPVILPFGKKPPKHTRKLKEAPLPADSEIKLGGGTSAMISGNYTCYALSNFINPEPSVQIAVAQPNRNMANDKDDDIKNNNSTNDNKSNTPVPATTHSVQPMIAEGREAEATKLTQEAIGVNAPKTGVHTKLPVLSKPNLQRTSSSSKDPAKKGALVGVECGKPIGTLFASSSRTSETREKCASDKPKGEKLPSNSTELTPHPPSVALPKLSKPSHDPSNLISGKI